MKSSSHKQVKKQCKDYSNIIRIRIQLQRLNSLIQRWPHPSLQKELLKDHKTEGRNQLEEIQRNLQVIFLSLLKKAALAGQNKVKETDFDSIDILPRRRSHLLQRLDALNDSTKIKVDKTFQVLNQNISNQVHYFLENSSKFVNKSHLVNIPENTVGYEFLKTRIGLEKAKPLFLSQVYNDQVFYVKLLNQILQEEPDVDLKNEESLLKNNQQDKSRLSLSKTSKGRRIRYTVIEKLKNFVERTRKKTYNSEEFTDFLISSLTKEVELGNSKYNLDSFLELFRDEKFETLTLKAPIKHAYRIISLSEQIKRSVPGVQTHIEMVNFFDNEGDRRLNSKLLIRIHRK
ncbi:conserved hypothetical protein [Theileria equi strain WA]|uniref:Apoptosis-antagonizing transcription factor C-terminal domain-containing protein n=1 Tax=Theileria equi strain WA TaxID=1537102 RepID=L1LC28_THEEQ|nr:conserved hypothetical protein [Theileria equi strain WA]EKX72723.1 conserved hypothetical protein [Theileria equi strain WA]|eukprot:XP_004832175.1 conserved hypothetical protein [Theileria equi strain WA]